jgi:hypothetical protein
MEPVLKPRDTGNSLFPGPFEMELAGLEPATSWVRSFPGRFAPETLGLFG